MVKILGAILLCTSLIGHAADLTVVVRPDLTATLKSDKCINKSIKEASEVLNQFLGSPQVTKSGTYVHNGVKKVLCWVDTKDGYWIVDQDNGYGFIKKLTL